MKSHPRQFAGRLNPAKTRLNSSGNSTPGNCGRKLKRNHSGPPRSWKGKRSFSRNSARENCRRKLKKNRKKGPKSWTRKRNSSRNAAQNNGSLRFHNAELIQSTKAKTGNRSRFIEH